MTRPDPIDEYPAHAEFHARENQTGIGAAVVSSEYEDGKRIWDCVVSDGGEWHYIRVESTELGPFPNISSEDVEEGIIRFAATLPAPDRIRHLLNANPLHMDRDGAVSD
ncbi:MAG: hypothetical protein ACXVHL_36870 [Solirubrobacteraceae bacterium]